jgi:uncharacterized protein (UPF0335 family)
MPPRENHNMMIGRNTAAGEKLIAYADRIERLLEEIDGLKQDLKDLKSEAKGEGFNVQALTKLVTIRRSKGRADSEAEFLNDLVLYAHATGTPLDVAFSMHGWEGEDDARPEHERKAEAGAAAPSAGERAEAD